MNGADAVLPLFDDVGDWFLSLGTHESPALLHGQLCGVIAGGHPPSASQWRQQAAELLQVELIAGTPIAGELEQLLLITQAQFAATDFALQLLLPDDDCPLQERSESLGLWCQGFLHGYALAGNTQQQLQQLAPVCTEILRDFSEIAQIEFDSQDEAEAGAEQDFMQVCEYVRMGAMQIYLELHPAPEPAPSEASGNAGAALFQPGSDRLH